jgi:hypothetical protein
MPAGINRDCSVCMNTGLRNGAPCDVCRDAPRKPEEWCKWRDADKGMIKPEHSTGYNRQWENETLAEWIARCGLATVEAILKAERK